MPPSENVLLEKFVQTQDPQAFSEIVHRYAGLVYGTCMRVLADADKAADVVQDTFLQLLKNADNIRGSVPTWLHRVATNKSVDVIRRDSYRRKREARYVGEQPREVTDWSEISRYVDEGLETLEPQTRQLIIAHFLQGATTGRLAEACGVSQPTVSRRIDSGVAQLRGFLKKRGILVAVATLSGLLGANAVQAAPPAVISELGKISLVGGPAAAAASSGTAGSAAGGLLATAKARFIATVAAAVIGGGTTFVVYDAVVSAPSDDTVPAAPDTFPSAPPSQSTSQVSTASSVQPSPPVAQDDSQLPPQLPVDTAVEPVEPAVDGGPPLTIADPPAMMGGLGFGGGMGMGAYPQTASDFTSPETTISSFAAMLATGDMQQIASCFAPGAADLDDLGRILTAPESSGDLMMKQVFQSVGPPTQVIDVIQEVDGVAVKWLFTVISPFAIGEGPAVMAFEPGDKFEMDARLIQVDGKWLIAGI